MHRANESERTTAVKKKKKMSPCTSKKDHFKKYKKRAGKKTIPGKEISNLSVPTLPVPIRTKNMS